MKTTTRYVIVLVTAPDRKVARRLARVALENRAAACANLVPGIESHYWWKGKMESGKEILVIFKTDKIHLAKLENLVIKNHPYDTPEFIVLQLDGGAKRYLDWITESMKIG